jgi:hypothetical protein
MQYNYIEVTLAAKQGNEDSVNYPSISTKGMVAPSNDQTCLNRLVEVSRFIDNLEIMAFVAKQRFFDIYLKPQLKRTILLKEIILDLSVVRCFNKLNKTDNTFNNYWDEDLGYFVVDYGLVPLNRFDRMQELEVENLPPILLKQKGNHYDVLDGRHRVVKHLIKGYLNPTYTLIEGVHYILADEFEAEASSEVIPTKVLFLDRFSSSIYLFYDAYKNIIYTLHKADWERRESPVIEMNGFKCKFTCNRAKGRLVFQKFTRLNSKWCVKSILQEKEIETFEAQSILDTIKKLPEACSNFKAKFMDFLKGVSFTFNAFTKIGSFVSDLDSLTGKASEITSLVKDRLNKLLSSSALKVIQVLLSCTRFIQSRSYLDLAGLILDLIMMFKSPFQAQSLESLLTMGLSSLLPDQLTPVLRKMHLLTNRKILDDTAMFFDFLGCISSLFDILGGFIPDSCKKFYDGFIALLGLKEFSVACKVKDLLKQWHVDKKLILLTEYRSKVKEVNTLISQIDMKKMLARNKPLSDVMDDFQHLQKAVDSFEQTSRKEPVCFIFEGQPGTLKSVTMNKIISILNRTHYSHILKPTDCGKDFYDAYNNEEIFYMDDVGQMGKSQWRGLINWVSCVKMPLECAEAKLKDTKYFNSEMIFLTTNNFMHLNGFTRADGIDDVDALFRRGLVFDFDEVIVNNGKISGALSFKFYPMNTRTFTTGFPEDFVEFMRSEDVDDIPPRIIFEDEKDAFVWMCNIITGFQEMRKRQDVINELAEDEKEQIRHYLHWAQSSEYNIPSFDTGMSDLLPELYETTEQTWTEMLSGYMDYLMTLTTDVALKAYEWITENPMYLVLASGLVLATCSFGYLAMELNSTRDAEGAFFAKRAAPEELASLPPEDAHELVKKISDQVYECDVVGPTQFMASHILMSERMGILPRHSLMKNTTVQLVVYKNRATNDRLIDNMLVKVIYENVAGDVAVIKLSEGFPTPWRKLAHAFRTTTDVPSFVVFPKRIVLLNGILHRVNDTITYNITHDEQNTVNAVTYLKLEGKGLCGSVSVTKTGIITGMHIAGVSPALLRDAKGVAVQWSAKLINDLKSVLNQEDLGLKIHSPISDKVKQDNSGIKLDTVFSTTTPKNSNFIPSPLYGIYPITRIPANLSVNGPHTVKDCIAPAFTPQMALNFKELEFVEATLGQYFAQFDDLTDHEIIKGTEFLAGINKDSSNGHYKYKTKDQCIDFETGVFRDEFLKDYSSFEERMATGTNTDEDLIWNETLKDELRSTDKVLPRSFRVSTLPFQVLTKKCFGKMVEHIVKNMWSNQIMIGVNPYKDWQRLYNFLVTDYKWAGDIKSYDKNMKVQIQQIVSKVIMKYYVGKHRQAASNILNNLPFSFVLVNDDAYITSHSLPTGSYLTAIFNSLVNRAYTLIWYHREMTKNGKKFSPFSFRDHIDDFVYGDDKVNVCREPKYRGFLNALTMREFFESLDMGFTDSSKLPIGKPFQHIEEITFLKRSFEFHHRLNCIVGPLDTKTLYSGLSFIDSSKEDLNSVMQDKIHCFQREMFLHEDDFDREVWMLERFCQEKGVPFHSLDIPYLLHLYQSGEFDEMYKKKFFILN